MEELSDTQAQKFEQRNLNKLLASFFSENNSTKPFDKHLKSTIEREADLLYTLIDNTNDMICAIDTNFQVLLVNKNYRQYLINYYGFDIKVGDNLLEKEPIAQEKEWITYYQRALKGEHFSIIKERFFDSKNWFFEITFNPLRNQTNEIIGTSWFVKDISEQKRLEKQLRIQNEELSVVNQELDRFVYSASHDLRAPLSSLLGLINLVRLESEPENLSTYLDMMTRSIHKMDKFIKDIIYHSKNTRLEVVSSEIHLETLFHDILEDLHYMEGNERIQKKITIEQDEYAFYSDKNRLRVILTNLISNAIRYADLTKEKPFIAIHAKITEQMAEISIEDNGKGIEEEHITRIFDMFYRASSDNNGSGLGLYMVKEVVEKLQGTIHVRSVYEKGSIFSLQIPNLQ